MALVETPIYPGAIANESHLENWRNITPSLTIPTLSGSIISTDLTIVLTGGSGVALPADNFVVSIDSEIIFVGTRTSDTLSSCTRGYEGTTAAGHASAATVTQRITAKSHNQTVSEINSIQSNLGINLSNVRKTGITVVTFSATPIFNALNVDTFEMTLTGSVTSSTITNSTAGDHIIFHIIQDGTGGRTFVWPTSFRGAASPSPTASKCTTQGFSYNGTLFRATGPGVVT